MLDHDEKSKRFAKSLWNFTKGFTLLLTYEVIEELLEEAIAWTITTVMARALSFIIVVLLTQTTKVTIKGLAKGITVLLKPIVKKITYKVGNDKIDKIRRIYKAMKNVFVKFFAFVARNKNSILATATGLLSAFGSAGLVDGGLVVGGVNLPKYAYYLIAFGVAVVMFVPTFIGVKGAGYEKQEDYDARVAKEQAEKDEKKALKEAEAQAKAEEEALLKAVEAEEAKKLADEEARRAELAKQQREQEEKAKEEQTRLEAQKVIREYEDAKVQGFNGTLREFIAQRAKK